MSSWEDSQLIEQCRNGGEAAFDILYHRYRLPLYAYLNHLMAHRRDLVDDLFQQTWIRASRNLAIYQERQKFFSWLCRIAHNLSMDFFRSRVSKETEEVPESVPSEEVAPDKALFREELRQAVALSIEKLPREQASVVELRMQGVAFKDIAAQQGITLNTALGRMHYAVLRLKKLLADFI